MYILNCQNFHNPCLKIWLTLLNNSHAITGYVIMLSTEVPHVSLQRLQDSQM